MKVFLNGRTSLEETSADMDIHVMRKELRDLQSTIGRMPPAIKKLIKQPDLPETLPALFFA